MLVRFRLAPALCALMVASQMLWLLAPAAHAGEFGATFNSRLTCDYSSWHEAKVVENDGKQITIAIVRDLLRHAPRETYKVTTYGPKQSSLRRGDLVLVNCWTKPRKIDWSKFPNSFPFRPHLIGKIDPTRKEVQAHFSEGYASRLVTWFYRTGRWDARMVDVMERPKKYALYYAKLPSGRRYLIWDQNDPRRPPEYPARQLK